MFGTGISKTGDLIELGVTEGLIKKSGAFYSYQETKLGQGREAAKSFLKENPTVMQEIEGLLRTKQNAADQPDTESADVSKLADDLKLLTNNE